MGIIYPDYICIVEKTGSDWRIKQPQKVFWRAEDSNIPKKRENREETYGLNYKEMLLSLFRQYLGKIGFYIVNMRDREYYYCGLTQQNIQEKLFDLGITKRDPMEGKI
jgi:hypothetical protein